VKPSLTALLAVQEITMPNDLVPVPSSSGAHATSPSPALRPEIFDPTGLGPIPGVPLIPKPSAAGTTSSSRPTPAFVRRSLLQHLWRSTEGSHRPLHRRHRQGRKLGSRISAKAGELGANFIDPAILPIVNHALIYRESGAVYDLDRLKTNLLSSQPLVFNTFGLLKRDLRLATRLWPNSCPARLPRSPTSSLRRHPAAAIRASPATARPSISPSSAAPPQVSDSSVLGS
jgi:hypothetical protein